MEINCCHECFVKPITALIIFIVMIVPSIVVNVIPLFLLSVVYFPYDAYMVIKCIVLSPHFGLKLKILGFILFFPCGILYPVFVLIGSVAVGFYVAGHCAIDFNILNIFHDTKTIVIEYEKFLRNSVYDYTHQMIYPLLGESVKVYDISFQLMFVCLIASTIGFIVNFVCAIPISVVYVIPLIIRCEYEILGTFCELSAAMFLFAVPFVIGVCLAPFIIAIIGMVFPIAFAIVGLGVGITTYQKTFEKAMFDMLEMIKEAEKAARECAFN